MARRSTSRRRSRAQKLTLVMEGDSWCRLPSFPVKVPVVGGANYDFGRALEARGHIVHNLARWSDTIRQIRKKREYINALHAPGVDAFFLSGGGNDLLGGQMLRKCLRLYDKDRPVNRYFKPFFFTILNRVLADYEMIIEDIAGQRKLRNIPIFSHGYDYAVPGAGVWLAEPMEFMGIKKKSLQKALVKHMIDRLNVGQRALAREHRNFHHINLRNRVKGRWHDELHARKPAVEDMSKTIERSIKRIV